MLTVRGQQHSFFWQTNGCFCESVKVFETENVSTWVGLEPPTFGFMPNALIYCICCPMFLNTGSGGVDILEVKLPFEMVTVRATAFIFWHTNGWSCQSFWDIKCLDLRGTRTPTFGFINVYMFHLIMLHTKGSNKIRKLYACNTD